MIAMAELAVASATRDTVLELSALRGEPRWLSDFRLKSFDLYLRLPVEQSELYKKYVDLAGLDLNKIILSSEAKASPEPQDLISKLKGSRPGIFLAHIGGRFLQSEVPEELQEIGLIFDDIGEAIGRNPEYFRPYFIEKAIMPEEDKFVALNCAFFSCGGFLYIPKGIEVNAPFISLSIIDQPGSAIFSHTLIVVDVGSKVNFIEVGLSRESDGTTPSLHSSVVEVYLKDGAEVNFGGVHIFGPKVIALSNKRSIGGRDSRMVWAIGHVGGGTVKSKLDSVMKGQGASSEDYELVVGDGTQRFDITQNLIHEGPNTTGQVKSNATVTDSAKALFKGLIKIGKEAKNSRSYLAEHAMLLSPDASANTIPGLEIENNDVRATHSSSIAQISEEQLFYLMSRGLSESEAKRVIVRGFFEPTIKQIPLAEIRGMVRALVDLKLSGLDVYASLQRDTIDAYLGEEGELPVRRDVFEGHYKYR